VAALTTTIAAVLETAERLGSAGAAANEANTKHHLIDPVLRSLGWNLQDFHEVDREFRVYDGTFLDYALRIDGAPRLFVEAKALGKQLTDKAFIAQTVNYANNEGVTWCVLTNGLVYHVYRSNEPVSMERKLLFEVDLRDGSGGEQLHQVALALTALSRESVCSGKLDAWGVQVFIDMRVREALVTLASAGSSDLVAAVGAALDGPALPVADVAASVQRVLGGLGTGKSHAAAAGAPPTHKAASDVPPKVALAPAHSLERHLVNKPSAVIDLFQSVDTFAAALGPDVTRRPTTHYVGYFAGKKSFFTMEVQKAKIWVYLSLPPVADRMRDASNIGHFGMGDTEFRLASLTDIPSLHELIRMSYLRNRRIGAR
jgi:predicted transport protein